MLYIGSSLVPKMLFPPPVTDHLQYANTEGETPWDHMRWCQSDREWATKNLKHFLVMSVQELEQEQFPRQFPRCLPSSTCCCHTWLNTPGLSLHTCILQAFNWEQSYISSSLYSYSSLLHSVQLWLKSEPL